jgi:XTP/dITP diphosphohydrolase
MSAHDALHRLVETMATLRGPGGCPWDAEQTHESLVPYVIEEVYELVEALESGSPEDVKEELGDVLYQVLFHADIAAHASNSPFTIDDVAAAVDEKMRVRHPHVFADGDAASVDEVVKRWDEIKKEQKAHRESVVEGIPEKLSALARAASVVKRSKDVLLPPTSPHPTPATEEELGQWLLGMVADARAQGFDAERALRGATRQWEQRVRAAEQAARNGVQAPEES